MGFGGAVEVIITEFHGKRGVPESVMDSIRVIFRNKWDQVETRIIIKRQKMRLGRHCIVGKVGKVESSDESGGVMSDSILFYTIHLVSLCGLWNWWHEMPKKTFHYAKQK